MPPYTCAYDCVVLGSGVLGLSIADELTNRGLRVAIVARDLPEDVHSSAFASPWAGANWASFASNPAERRRDIATFRRLASLAAEHPDLVRRTPFVYVWNEGEYDGPWYRDVVYDYRVLPRASVPPGWTHAVGFTSYTLNPPRYLAHLASSLRSRGVPILRHPVSSLDEAYALLGPVSLVINATGLGSRTLLGVEDMLVHPIRGQTVTVRAPAVVGCFGNKDPLPEGQQCVIIPRPGPEGHVTLGGTFLPNNYSTLPDPDAAERILRDAYRLCPQLASGSDNRSGTGPEGRTNTWKDIQIVSHNVGLRPARTGGMRLELEHRVLGQDNNGRKDERAELVPASGQVGRGRQVGCVHAYGIGPAGYQASLGIAEEAADLAVGYLAKRESKL